MKSLLFVANWISLSFLLTLALPLLRYTQTADVFYIQLPVGILVTNVAVEGAKRVFGSAGLFGRPQAAEGCDLFCIGSSVGGQPGFPSGHVTAVTMFVVASWLHTKEVLVLVVGIPWIAAMAWSRWYKHCHNVPQVLGGLVTGAASALVYSAAQRISS